MEEKREILARTRNRIFLIKNRRGKSWQEVFAKCDKDQSGLLNYAELSNAVRDSLNIPECVIYNYELKILFEEIDADGSGEVSIEELLQYLTQGHKTPEQVAAKAQVRLQRVRKSLKTALQAVASNEMAMRKMFANLDKDGDSTISQNEFISFVRKKLALTSWDVSDTDIKDFFKHLDRDGGGVQVDEFIAFVRSNQLDRPNDATALPPTPHRHQMRGGVKMKTYKQRLLEDNLRSVSLPDLSRLPYTSSVVGLGRTCGPRGRNSLRMSAQMFFNNRKQFS